MITLSGQNHRQDVDSPVLIFLQWKPILDPETWI